MKIGLIDPGSKKLLFNENFPHIGLAYVSSFLETKNHEVSCIDFGVENTNQIDNFLANKYDLIGLSATSFTFNDVLVLAERIKAFSKDTVVVLGGPHVSIGMTDCLQSPWIDFSIYGEGEKTLAELVESIETHTISNYEQLSFIPGIIFRNKDKVICNYPRPRITELDKLPFPAFHLFPMEKYGMYPLFTSRGCPFGCSFCSIKAIWGMQWEYRSANNIISEIEYAKDMYNWQNKPFNIVDDSFNVLPNRVMEFCDSIIDQKLNIQWFSSGFRADRVTYDLARKMKQSGCIGVSVGIESSNNRILKRINKKETIEQITNGCINLDRAGIPIQAQFMIGNPGDTYQTVRKSISYARKQNFSNYSFYLALPYPKTALWQYILNNGIFLEKDYTKFHHFSDQPVFETPEFTASERIAVYRLARRFTIIAKIRQELKTKFTRILRLDFKNLDIRRIWKAGERITKYFFDLVFNRTEKV